ncbi:MAG: hypothetical protein JO368_05255, partial [Acidimicrobiales bacterium]|nr:hypothetical protein [Acidimicrobiales bacterium]
MRVGRAPRLRSAAAISGALALVLVLPPLAVSSGPATAGAAAATGTSLHVTWMSGDVVPGTPTQYDRVGVIKVG